MKASTTIRKVIRLCDRLDAYDELIKKAEAEGKPHGGLDEDVEKIYKRIGDLVNSQLDKEVTITIKLSDLRKAKEWNERESKEYEAIGENEEAAYWWGHRDCLSMMLRNLEEDEPLF